MLTLICQNPVNTDSLLITMNEFPAKRQTSDTWMTTCTTRPKYKLSTINSIYVLHYKKSTLIMSIFVVLSVP